MKPGKWLAMMLPLVVAAAPVPKGHLPLPPIPPPHPPTDGPAPVPDRDVMPPLQPFSEGPTITPRFLRAPTYHRNFDQSQGYVSGSHASEDDADRRLLLSPGFDLRLPFR
jgi:hypothetical protein